jgi:VanZ family protein
VVSPTVTAGTSRLAPYAKPALVVYGFLLAVALLAPTSSVQAGLVSDLVAVLGHLSPAHGLITFDRMEKVMNAVIIMPVSFLATLVFPRLRWQDCLAYAFIGSGGVELVQLLVLPGRQASFSDIVANTVGGLLGALVAVLVRRWVGHRRGQR